MGEIKTQQQLRYFHTILDKYFFFMDNNNYTSSDRESIKLEIKNKAGYSKNIEKIFPYTLRRKLFNLIQNNFTNEEKLILIKYLNSCKEKSLADATKEELNNIINNEIYYIIDNLLKIGSFYDIKQQLEQEAPELIELLIYWADNMKDLHNDKDLFYYNIINELKKK